MRCNMIGEALNSRHVPFLISEHIQKDRHCAAVSPKSDQVF